ncbi:MAG: 16S rRNA (uracil(1498)-N(3))-methyltransferase [Puniceicoccales bacterium]|jgi:16S rRNA (uracil1498-N3)-methyltransferase|nr:16S rRNA (uracil(1498)-N(3))-methyltransferase [Puniceicoccales bacterium]
MLHLPIAKNFHRGQGVDGHFLKFPLVLVKFFTMATYYIYQKDGFEEGIPFAVDAGEMHHLLRVLRATHSDDLYAFDGQGTVGHGVLRMETNRRCIFIPQNVQRTDPPPPLQLLQGIVKHGAMEQIIRQGTQLGMTHLYPLCGQYSVVQFPNNFLQRHNRWRTIAIEACKQSKNPFLPSIEDPMELEKVLPTLPRDAIKIVLSLRSGSIPLKHWANNRNMCFPKAISIAIGPEGDFSPKEYEVLQQWEFEEVSLGSKILTSETAAVAILGIFSALSTAP